MCASCRGALRGQPRVPNLGGEIGRQYSRLAEWSGWTVTPGCASFIANASLSSNQVNPAPGLTLARTDGNRPQPNAHPW